MHRWLASLFLTGSLAAHAQSSCPRLQGTFHCRTSPAFDIQADDYDRDGVPVYSFTDPTGRRDIIVDGAFHELRLQNEVGKYTARCGDRDLFIEVHTPKGVIMHDRYFIERAALVRVRLSPGQLPAVLSCAPTNGTWELYPR